MGIPERSRGASEVQTVVDISADPSVERVQEGEVMVKINDGEVRFGTGPGAIASKKRLTEAGISNKELVRYLIEGGIAKGEGYLVNTYKYVRVRIEELVA